MKIVVSADGPDLEARVDPRFGRAPYFIFIDPDTLEFEAMTNQPNLQAAQGGWCGGGGGVRCGKRCNSINRAS
jgi:predicted Fe-Mo cluster-binding NifX family protein